MCPIHRKRWDPDVKSVKDVSGPCEDGTTFTFAMNDGNDIPMTLSNVRENKSVDFKGAAWGVLKAEGKVLIEPIDSSTSKINYSFEMTGLVGAILAMVKKKEIIHGVDVGLDNMKKMSEEAQGGK